MGLICLNNIRVYAFHGCMDEEARIGSDYTVDLKLETDFSKAAQSDSLEHTIDYVAANLIVREEMAIRSKLIEHVAARILQRLKLEFGALEFAEVTVTKINPPMGGQVDSVSVSMAVRNLN
jgi:dihydroneopterin aldolase